MPGSLVRAVHAYRRLRRNERINATLAGKSVALESRHIANLRVLTDRYRLLEEAPKHAVWAEVGVAEGGYSRFILDVCKPAKLHLIDLWSAQHERYAESLSRVRATLKEEIESGIVEIHRGRSWEMLERLPDDYLDWAYVDAAHDYDSVRKDLTACSRKVKRDGVIAGHDYTRWAANRPNRVGVVEAVNEFCVTQNWEMIYLTNEPDRILSFAIRRMYQGNP